MTRTVVSLAMVAVLALLAGCTPIPPDAWRIAPIAYDNLMDVEDGTPQVIDVTYPMDLAPDTAGGLWGESAGSWLHLDAEGTAVRRFNLDGEDRRPVSGFVALTPETLLVSTPPPGASGGIQLFDTVAGTWELLLSEQGLLGDLAVHDGEVYVVVFATGIGSFTVRRLPVDGSAPASDATPALPWPGTTGAIEDSVAIDVGPDGALYVATGDERIVVGPDGTVRDRAPQQTRTPRVAVSPDGAVVWSGGPAPSASIPVHVEGGSGEARAVLAQFEDCADDTLVVGAGTSGTAMPFLCEPQGIAWTSEGSFVVSVGGESGAVLARVTVPADPGLDTPAAPLPPASAGFDYQLGGGYPVPDGVAVVARDSTDEPADGMYSICYVNGFQTQPGEGEHWLAEHPDLVLHVDGEPFIDPGWPDEYLLDTSTAEKREQIAALLGTVVASCLTSGFDAVEIDNLDTYSRSDGALTLEDNIDLAARYARVAHDLGMAIGQKNGAGYSERLKREVGFDFAVTEECARYDECGDYVDAYGELVFDIEYDAAYLEAACDAVGSAVLRDLGLSPAGSPDYVFETC